MDIGAALLLAGGALCALAYTAAWVPWITFHDEHCYYNVSPTDWSLATDGGSFFQSGTYGIVAYSVFGYLLMFAAFLPLVMGATSVYFGIRAQSLGLSRVVRRLFWTIAILGALSLLFQTHTMDPFGWSADTFWSTTCRQPSTPASTWSTQAPSLSLWAGCSSAGPLGGRPARNAISNAMVHCGKERWA